MPIKAAAPRAAESLAPKYPNSFWQNTEGRARVSIGGHASNHGYVPHQPSVRHTGVLAGDVGGAQAAHSAAIFKIGSGIRTRFRWSDLLPIRRPRIMRGNAEDANWVRYPCHTRPASFQEICIVRPKPNYIPIACAADDPTLAAVNRNGLLFSRCIHVQGSTADDASVNTYGSVGAFFDT